MAFYVMRFAWCEVDCAEIPKQFDILLRFNDKTNSNFIMCQTSLISRNIVRISTRSFEQNVEAVSGNVITHNKLRRLNRALDSLYELIYSQFNDINSEDYKVIGPQMCLLLNTLKGLCNTFKNLRKLGDNLNEVECLGRNYSALYELNSDIKRFRLNREYSPNLTKALENASSVINLI